MSGAAHNLDQEFWRPPQSMPSVARTTAPVELCSTCGCEFVIGSRFCHVCGALRESGPAPARPYQSWDLLWLTETLGLTIGSLIALAFGLLCAGIALAVGLVYTTTTELDWQAVQFWRIQWLLGAAVAFLAGILLKRTAN